MIKKIGKGLLIVVLVALAAGYGYYRLYMYEPPLISEEDRERIQLMPLPGSLEIQSGFLDITEGMNLKLERRSDPRFWGFLRRNKSYFPIRRDGSAPVTLSIQVADETRSHYVALEEDESYSLELGGNSISLKANGPVGALRGLTTLLQLIQSAENGQIPAMKMEDSPRFPWRGLMLDVSRHWIPLEVILRTLDAMEKVKMNVLHLHLSDDQGFRVESKRFPLLHEVGANGNYFTQQEIRKIITYAFERGIRVIPEFDLPGHSKSWQIAYPALSSVDYPLEFGSKEGITFSPPVDPSNEYTYQFMDEFIGEMANLFPDPYFHIGGDEVNPVHWLENDSIVSFMKAKGLANAHELQNYFINRMNEIVNKYGKTMIGWEEVYQEGLSQQVVIQSWKSQKTLFHAVAGGTPGILSTGYYLDLIQPAGTHYAVDPAVIPNAVEIRPDTAYWKMYDLTLLVGDNPMTSKLVVFDKDPENVYGFISMLDQLTAFTEGTLKDNELTFSMETPYGEMSYTGVQDGDSIAGKISVMMLDFDASGQRSGGSDLTGGEPLPEIEYLAPLTDQEKDLILGGEACMWSEFVDARNIESRLWPRTAAIAEKLWSPASLTTNEEDMYRRLAFVEDRLLEEGIPFKQHSNDILKDICDGECYETLKSLVEIFEEVKFHARMSGLMERDSFYLPELALDRIVDASTPESYRARAFNRSVDEYMENPDEELKDQLLGELRTWHTLSAKLIPFTQENERINEIRTLLEATESLTGEAILRLNGEAPILSRDTTSNQLMRLENGEGDVIVAIYPGLRKLLSE